MFIINYLTHKNVTIMLIMLIVFKKIYFKDFFLLFDLSLLFIIESSVFGSILTIVKCKKLIGN